MHWESADIPYFIIIHSVVLSLFNLDDSLTNKGSGRELMIISGSKALETVVRVAQSTHTDLLKIRDVSKRAFSAFADIPLFIPLGRQVISAPKSSDSIQPKSQIAGID